MDDTDPCLFCIVNNGVAGFGNRTAIFKKILFRKFKQYKFWSGIWLFDFFANHQVWQCAKLSLANHTLCTSPFTFTWQLSCATQSYLYPWILLFRYLTQPIADNNIILPVHVVLWNILHYGGTAHTCGIITDDTLVYSSHIPVITQYNVISYCTQRCNGQEVTAFP